MRDRGATTTAAGKLIDYQDRVARVTAYIHDHLDKELDLGKLTEVACLSPYHWYRIYLAVHGETAAVPEADLRAGIINSAEIPIEAPLEQTEIAGGPYAILRHKELYADMPAAYRWLFGAWLVNSGREPADAPCFEAYLNIPRDTPAIELLTNICLPLVAD